MPPISHLLMLIAAFFGADLSAAWVDLPPVLEDLDDDLVTEFCFAFDVEEFDFHNDYSDDWHAWERCMLSYNNGINAQVHSSHRLSRSEAEQLVAEIWETYTPWMREALSESLYFPHDEDGPFRIVLADDWAPPLPRINTGVHKVDLHCGDDDYFLACAVQPNLVYDTGERLDDTVIWWSSSTVDVYTTYLGEVEHETRGRIVTPRRNRYVVLHELAHLINDYGQVLWGDDEPYTETMRENLRAGGHGIEFRCLLLDLYTNYGDSFVDTDLWWAESYEQLHRLCQFTAPNYARPTAPIDS